MTLLISFATGGRPETSRSAQTANLLTVGLSSEVHAVVWRSDTWICPEYRTVDMEGAGKGECLNESLALYMREHDGVLPDYWLTMDDDVVLSEHTIGRLIDILVRRPDIALLGVGNDYLEPDRGSSIQITSPRRRPETVQFGTGFCVGGAVHLMPRKTLRYMLDLRGRVYSLDPRREDEELCAALRLNAPNSCAVARDVGVAILPDDGVWPSYRGRILAMHYTGWDGKHAD